MTDQCSTQALAQAAIEAAVVDNLPLMTPEKRETLGQYVRCIWVEWAREQVDVRAGEHPNWLTPWEELSERDREIDRRIGERLYLSGFMDGKVKR